MLDKYRLVGTSYDRLSKLYSGNAIEQCRLSFLNKDHIKQDNRILFAGAGQGRDVIHTASLAGSTTMIDISPTMMDSFLQELEKADNKDDLNIKSILGDILKHEEKGKYDIVVANFFLTVFDKSKMQNVLDHLIKLCKPGGKIIIGDFSPLTGNLLQKTLQQAYWYAAATAFFALTGNAIHELYDYKAILENKGLKLIDQQSFEVLGQTAFQSIIAEKQ